MTNDMFIEQLNFGWEVIPQNPHILPILRPAPSTFSFIFQQYTREDVGLQISFTNFP